MRSPDNTGGWRSEGPWRAAGQQKCAEAWSLTREALERRARMRALVREAQDLRKEHR